MHIAKDETSVFPAFRFENQIFAQGVSVQGDYAIKNQLIDTIVKEPIACV